MLPVVLLECSAQVQVVPRRRRKADQDVDPISLGDLLDSEEVDMNALIRFYLRLECHKTEVQFVVSSYHIPICAVPGIGEQTQAVTLKTVDPKQYDHDSEYLVFVV